MQPRKDDTWYVKLPNASALTLVRITSQSEKVVTLEKQGLIFSKGLSSTYKITDIEFVECVSRVWRDPFG